MGATVVEEKRKKTGMEVLPSLMEGLKKRAVEQHVPLWKVVQDAFAAYLGVEPPANEIPRHLWRYPEKLRKVLASGHPRALSAVTANLDGLLELVQLAKQARKAQ
jgi:hypothetical protein